MKKWNYWPETKFPRTKTPRKKGAPCCSSSQGGGTIPIDLRILGPRATEKMRTT